MGWTEYWATEYSHGRINRRAECRKYFERNEKWGTLLKDAMVGSVWYGAVKLTATGEVFGMIMLTSERDKYWFGYKELDETCGPCHNDCPESILKLLSPTDNESANAWRAACRERHEFKKKLNKAKLISVVYPFDTTYTEAGTEVTLRKEKWDRKNRWWGGGYYTPLRLLLQGKVTIIE